MVETRAAHGIGADGEAYLAAGAQICANGEEVYGHSDLIVK